MTQPEEVSLSFRSVLACIAAPVLLTSVLFAQAPEQPSAVARKALDLLLAEKYSDIRTMLAPSAGERFTEEYLRNQLGGKIRTFGELHGISDPVMAEDGGLTLVSFPVHFAAMRLSIQFTLNGLRQLTDVSLRPSGAPLPKLWQRPAYSDPRKFTEREVTIGSDEWKLPGTLTVPAGKGPFPAVVLVHGPGPNDRDESIYSNRIFRDLAEGLSSRGIAVLRYDKRSLVYGKQMGGQDYTLAQETTDDALRAIAVVRMQPEVAAARVYVLGHSLGGYAAPRIAARDGKLAGLIFLAANARPIEDVALDQNDYVAHLNGEPTAQVQQRLDALKAEVAKVKGIQPGSSVPQMVMGLPGVYLLDLKDYDPAIQAKQLTIPLLFLQGDRDFQVTAKDFSKWKSALEGRSNVTFHEYVALNHLFISGEGKPAPAEYLKAGNVDSAVIADISAFITAR
ncbi:MAG: alpha/beta fold hydrolase [Acidobacteriia bacterium]|nr:alpha/beta fold hydrolase [Terriglobia bacterium]